MSSDVNFVSPTSVISATVTLSFFFGRAPHDPMRDLTASWKAGLNLTEKWSETHLIALLHHQVDDRVHHDTGPVDNVGKHVQVWLRVAGIKLNNIY